PCCASSTSKVLRYFPVAPFASSALLPSGAVTVMPSRRIGTWSGKNSWLDTAASKVTQTSPPLTTACDGMIHCLCAEAVMGSTAARASASARVFFIFGLRKGMRVVWPGSDLGDGDAVQAHRHVVGEEQLVGHRGVEGHPDVATVDHGLRRDDPLLVRGGGHGQHGGEGKRECEGLLHLRSPERNACRVAGL